MALESIPFAPSDNIQGVWHEPQSNTLLVRYHHRDRVYRYPGISAVDAAGFSQSLSANDHLRQVFLTQATGSFAGILPPGETDIDDIRALTDVLG